MKPRTTEDSMLIAANLVEREGHYDFNSTGAPETCDDVGCVLGWIGYVIGVKSNCSTAKELGYTDGNTGPFYEDMRRICGDYSWMDDCRVAADTLRALVQERIEASTQAERAAISTGAAAP